MVLDSSAIVAVVLREPEHERLTAAIESVDLIFIGAPTLVETNIVLSARLKTDALPLLREFLQRLEAEVVEFGDLHVEAAALAFSRFGKGRHRAALNFGDCMSYAVASIAGMPLLFVGEDFAQTDILPAL